MIFNILIFRSSHITLKHLNLLQKMGLRNGKLQPIILPEHLEFLIKTSGLTEEQVKSEYEHFLKEHPDNRISKKAFKEMINQVR